MKVYTLDELREKTTGELAEIAGSLRIEHYSELRRPALIYSILQSTNHKEDKFITEAVAEVLNEGYGFLRYRENNYLPSPDDVYLHPFFIKKYKIKTGNKVRGILKPPKDQEKFFALQNIETIEDESPELSLKVTDFEKLTPLYPDQKINLEREPQEISMRVMDLFVPIGKGQRGLIVAPPRTGKTILLQKIANSITENHPEIHLLVLLVAERPEEVTDMQRNIKGQVIYSTFDESAYRNVTVAEMALERAKRLTERKKDVVILLDSITRLARAYNQIVPSTGKVLSGGFESTAMQKPKKFFGAARKIEEGGSLTILATALIETGSKMDEVIFEEFKGTGNMEVRLDRELANRRIFPAINLHQSGTRHEELLISPDDLKKIWLLRKTLIQHSYIEIMELLIDKLQKTSSNKEFLDQIGSKMKNMKV